MPVSTERRIDVITKSPPLSTRPVSAAARGKLGLKQPVQPRALPGCPMDRTHPAAYSASGRPIADSRRQA